INKSRRGDQATNKRNRVGSRAAGTVENEENDEAGRGRCHPWPSPEIPARQAWTVADGTGQGAGPVIQKFERGAHRMRVSQLWRVADGLGVPVTELLGVTRTNTNEITDMVDPPMARRLMEAFQGLTSGERRCLTALAEELAARRQRPHAAPATTEIGSDEQ